MANDLLTPLSRLTELLPWLLDPRVGIITTLREHPAEADSPNFIRFNCSAANTEAFGPWRNFAVGGGASTNRDLALAKAIGEAIERYCAAIYDKSSMPLVSWQDADFPCVDPARFALYAPDQHRFAGFMFDPFDRAAPVRWVPAQDGRTGQTVHVPASMVYVPYVFYHGGDETPINQPISTGLSCHCSYAEAALGGLCEVIERDCFAITWQARLSRPRVRLDSLPPDLRDLARRFEAVGYQVALVNITNETGIPTIMAVARHPLGTPPLAVAAACATTATDAVRKALEELAHTERYAFQILKEVPRTPPDPEFDAVLGQVDHISYWCDPAVTGHAAFLTAAAEEQDFASLPSLPPGTPAMVLAAAVETLHATGYQALFCDITTDDIASLGLRVVRAIVPGYHPLFMGYHHRARGGDRLWQLPQQLGFAGLAAGQADNPFPHPFP